MEEGISKEKKQGMKDTLRELNMSLGDEDSPVIHISGRKVLEITARLVNEKYLNKKTCRRACFWLFDYIRYNTLYGFRPESELAGEVAAAIKLEYSPTFRRTMSSYEMVLVTTPTGTSTSGGARGGELVVQPVLNGNAL